MADDGFAMATSVCHPPPEKLKRSVRRHHRGRMIRHALKVIDPAHWSEAEKHRWALRNYDNAADCSCVYCMSPRRRDRGWRGLTPQERRALFSSWDDQRSLMSEGVRGLDARRPRRGAGRA